MTIRAIADYAPYTNSPLASNPVTLNVINGGPTSDFDAVTGATYKVNFTNTSVNATSYIWIFGDGLMDTTSSSNPITHTYANIGANTVTLIAKNSSKCADTLKKIVDVGSIELVATNAYIEVFPNPVINDLQIVISGNELNIPYIITNLQGVVVSSGIIKSDSWQVNVSNLPEGMYLLQVKNKTLKFLKK